MSNIAHFTEEDVKINLIIPALSDIGINRERLPREQHGSEIAKIGADDPKRSEFPG